jgi:hypothetical protein
MFSMAIAAAAGFLTARWWTLGLALVLPIVELWVWSGLGSYDRNGYENWGLVALPFWCLACLAVTAGAVALGRGRRRRR